MKGEKMGCQTFSDKGFKKWRDVNKALFFQHSQNERHLSSMSTWVNLKSISDNKTLSISPRPCTIRLKEIIEKIVHTSKHYSDVTSYLGRQGLLFRRHKESIESSKKDNFI